MIGYYVHHQGSGHLNRLRSVSARLHDPVTVLSSLPPVAGTDLPWVQLARDDASDAVVDATGRGTLHWVPRHDRGLLTRMAQIASWVERAGPDLVVVDVSVEVAALVRLLGVPVVVVAQPGDRGDRAHRLAYDLAEAVIAPWTQGLGVETPAITWRDKADFVGAFSRFDGLPRLTTVATRARPTGLLLWGNGGCAGIDARLKELRAAAPDWRWAAAGPGHLMGPAQLWSHLCASDVVVSHAGQNVVGEIAAARARAVVVADPRPFDEQVHTARALDATGLAVGLTEWPQRTSWPCLLRRAVDRGGDDWQRWSDGLGACRMAAALERTASRLRVPATPAPLDA